MINKNSLLSPQLQAFLAVAEYKTVHAAAERLYLTQTAVTSRLQSLEEKLKTCLFIRTRRGMSITSEGESLLRYCQAVQALEGETLSLFHDLAHGTEVTTTLCAPTSMMHARILPECYPILKKFPNLLLHFDVNDAETRHLALRSGQCQLAILRPEDVANEFSSKLLKPEQYLLVCSSAWKKRPLKEILTQERIIDFDPADQMTFNYLKQFNLIELIRHDRYFVNRTELIADMIVNEQGYGVLTREFSAPYLKDGRLTVLNRGLTHENFVYLAWYGRSQMPSYLTALINAIQ